MDDLGLTIATSAEGLPPADPKFRGPVRGGWQPDLSKYPPRLKGQVEKAIYD